MRRLDPLLRLATAALTTAALAALGGCTVAPAPGDPSTATADEIAAPELPPPADPAALLGTWRVSADGETADIPFAIGMRAFGLLRACGVVGGDLHWDGRALASRVGWFPEGCIAGGEAPRIDWLLAADRWRITGDGIELLLGDAVLATLRRDDAPPPELTVGYGLDPAPTPDQIAELRELPVRPAVGEPVQGPALVGTWHDADDPATTVVFDDDGGWRVDDGCNGGAGAWRIGPDGHLLSIVGPTTLKGCPHMSELGGTLGLAAWAVAVDDDIRLVEADGSPIVRLVRGAVDR